MSDSEGAAAASSHPTTGGKSIETVQAQQNRLQGERQPYKSWRKKYRKMRVKFDGVLEENKTLFKQEHKLEGTAKRLREELDELLEILLDVNESAAIPTDLRFDVRTPAQRERPKIVDPDITPEDSTALMGEYTTAISKGLIPPIDLNIVRDQIDEQLAAQGVPTLEELEARVPHPIFAGEEDLPEEDRGDEPPSFLSTAQETEYLQRLDAKLGDRLSLDKDLAHPQSPHQAELTPRELERHMELLNPQSQHNWLKLHSKMHAALDNEDTESLASHEGGSTSKPAGRKRGKNLAKQVGDRAMERAYDVMSPSAASGFDEDETMIIEEPGSGRKRARDPDGAYRVKGGRGGAVKGGKRKRLTEDAAGASKKVRMSENFGADA